MRLGIGFSGELGFVDRSSGPTVERTSCAEREVVARKTVAAQVIARSIGLLRFRVCADYLPAELPTTSYSVFVVNEKLWVTTAMTLTGRPLICTGS